MTCLALVPLVPLVPLCSPVPLSLGSFALPPSLPSYHC